MHSGVTVLCSRSPAPAAVARMSSLRSSTVRGAPPLAMPLRFAGGARSNAAAVQLSDGDSASSTAIQYCADRLFGSA